MAIFNTVWSLDVGRSSLKAVRLRREKGNIEILAVDKLDYKPGKNGVDNSRAKEAINAFRVRNDVKDPVIVAHHGQGTLSRFIKIPAFDQKKIKEMVGYEASQQIPFPLDEVIWDYHIIERDYLPGEEREVGLFAARREAIDDFLLDFSNENLAVEGLTIGYLGLLNYIFYDLNPQEPIVVLDIGATHTDLILVDGRRFWIRALPHSGNEINKAIMERLRLGFAEAEKLKIEIARNPKQAVKLFASVIQPKLRELVNQIHQSIGFYRSQAGEVQFKQLYLLGNASKIVGIKKFLAEHLGVKVQRVQTINNLRVNRDVDLRMLQANLPAFGTAFGCALQGVGAGSCRVDLIPQEEKLQKEYERKKVHVFIAIGILFLATLISGFLVRNKVKDASRQANSNAAFLKPIKANNATIQKIRDISRDFEKETLEKVAELRNAPSRALRLLGEVLAGLELGEPHVKWHQPTDEADKDKFLAQMRFEAAEAVGKKLWVPWLQVERIFWPEDPEKKSGSRRKEELEGKVPAYKLTVFAVVQYRVSPQESLKLITDRLKEPLEANLRQAEGLTVTPEASVSSDFQTDLETIYHDPAQRKGRSRGREEKTHDGAPFFGTELSWILRLQEPPEEKPEEDTKKDKKRG